MLIKFLVTMMSLFLSALCEELHLRPLDDLHIKFPTDRQSKLIRATGWLALGWKLQNEEWKSDSWKLPVRFKLYCKQLCDSIGYYQLLLQNHTS